MRSLGDAEDDRAVDVTPRPVPRAPWRVADVRALPGFRLHVRFNDGTEGEVDLAGLVQSSEAGVFAALRDEALFDRVRIHVGAVTWPGGLDLAPDAMHREITTHGTWVLR